MQKAARLFGQELQLVRPHLTELPSYTQAGEWQRGIGARGDGHVDMGRRVFHERGQRLVDRFGSDDMIIIEREDKISSILLVQIADEQGNDRLGRRWRRGRGWV